MSIQSSSSCAPIRGTKNRKRPNQEKWSSRFDGAATHKQSAAARSCWDPPAAAADAAAAHLAGREADGGGRTDGRTGAGPDARGDGGNTRRREFSETPPLRDPAAPPASPSMDVWPPSPPPSTPPGVLRLHETPNNCYFCPISPVPPTDDVRRS